VSELEQSPEIFTADYLGEPGKRTFFLQTQGEDTTRSFLVEKQQVSVLAERMRDVLLMIDENDTIKSALPARDPGLNAAQPVEPEWRVGNMGLAYDEEEDLVVVLLEEAQPAEEEEEPEPDAGAARVLIRRDQARSFILHAIAIVNEGRPICQLCGLPMDPEGHQCPASNGHHVDAPSGI
jgi:uncharacterized repeat protein (TIGR03847 family)